MGTTFLGHGVAWRGRVLWDAPFPYQGTWLQAPFGSPGEVPGTAHVGELRESLSSRKAILSGAAALLEPAHATPSPKSRVPPSTSGTTDAPEHLWEPLAGI